MLHEISRRCIHINKHEETSLIHHNSLLTLRGDKHLHVLDFSYNVHCLDKKLDFVESSILCPKSSATSELIRNYASKGVKNIELIELITNPYLWPYSNDLKQEMTNIMAFEWSPTKFIYNNQSVLAILNTVGNLEIFGPKRRLWVSLMDFSSIIKQYLIPESDVSIQQNSMTMEKLKEVVYSISTSAMCWAPSTNDDGSCYFVTAQRDSTIIFWALKFQSNSFSSLHQVDWSVEKLGEIQADNGEITTMVWIPFTDNLFLFVYSNILGEVVGKVCKIENNALFEISTIILWKYKDRMVPKNIHYMVIENKILIIFSKHRHLVVQMFDKNFKVLSEVVKIINDERITTVTKAKKSVFIGTVNTKIYKVHFMVKEEDLKVDFEILELKDPYINHDLYGLAFSSNDLICHMVVMDRKVNYRKEQLNMLIVSLSSEDNELENTLFHSNLSNNLTDMWDGIELLRYRTMKTKKLPSLDFESFFKNADNDTYKLKLYLILVKLYNSLEGILKNLSKGLLPETSIEVVQDKLLAIHASSCITKIYEKYKENSDLNNLENEWLSGCSKYIEYYCKKYETSRETFISNKVWNEVIIANMKTNLPAYTCQFCDDIVEGFTCSNGHINMFCSVTLTQIDSMEYLVCKRCNVTARMDLCKDHPLCVFCDSHLDQFYA